MKTCKGCNIEKPDAEYYMTRGRPYGKCKACVKTAVRANRAKRREQYSMYERMRSQLPHRKEQTIEAQRRRRRRNPQKAQARNAVSNAIRTGKIERQPCKVCGDPESQAHHHDYSKPLDVTWLCFKHHRELEHGQIVVAA